MVLRPQARLVQDLGAGRDRGIEEGPTASRLGAVNAMCDSLNPSPVDLGPIQNSGMGATPKPTTSPKSITLVPPSGASTAS